MTSPWSLAWAGLGVRTTVPGQGGGCAGGETQQVCDRLVTKVSRLCEVPPSVSTEADPGLISA